VASLSVGTKYTRVSPGIGVGKALTESTAVLKSAGGSSSLPRSDGGVLVRLLSYVRLATAGTLAIRFLLDEAPSRFWLGAIQKRLKISSIPVIGIPVIRTM
jgi:hypothetical protein